MIGRMKRTLRAAAAAATVALGLAAAGSPAAAQASKAQGKAPAAKELYVSNCQMCHGPDGKAAIPAMSFVGRKWRTKTHAEAVKTITEGVPGTVMMPFKGKLTAAEISALARYVRSLDKPPAKTKK
jgi:mono/diheme cytochrome c family protein